MALFKVVSNYYTDILDTINNSYVKNGKTFDSAFNNLNKLTLIKQLANTNIKMERVQFSTISYWQTQVKTYKTYQAFLSIIIITVFIIFVTFFYFRFKEIMATEYDSENGQMYEVCKSALIYIIMFFIIFAAIFMLLWNLKWLKQQGIAQEEQDNENFKQFLNLLYSASSGSYLKDVISYIGYVQTGNTAKSLSILNRYNSLIKQVNSKKKSTSATDKNSDLSTEMLDSTALTKYYNLMISITPATLNQLGTFTTLISDIKDNLALFYNNGNGYYTLEVLTVSSNNILTLRELRRVMNFHYFLTIKKTSDMDKNLKEESNKVLIKQLIITPITTATIPGLMSDPKKYRDLINTMANQIVPYQLNLTPYSKFITDALVKATPDITQPQSSFITDIFTRLSKEIFIKQQSSLKTILGDTQENSIFYDPDEFIGNLNDIVFNDMVEGLEIQYAQDLIIPFYNRISSAKDGKTLDDITFNSNKSNDIYKYFMTYFILITLLGTAYYIMGMISEAEIIKLSNQYREDIERKKLEEIGISFEDKSDFARFKANVAKINLTNWTNWWVRLLIPSAAILFAISLVYAYYQKKQGIFKYNQNVIEENTSEYKSSVIALNNKIIDLGIHVNDPFKRIGDISEIKDEDKFELFMLIKTMIDKFEKCNYMMEASKNKLPFPYTEITADIFMIVVLIGGIVYITSTFKPSQKIMDIINYKKVRDAVKNGEKRADLSLINELSESELCHEDEIDAIIFTMKLVFFILIFVFLIFYSTKILSESSAFSIGIYNSNYFEENRCYE